MLNTEHVWRHDRLAIGVWDLRSFRRPLKTAHYFSVATTGPTDRFLLVKPVDVTEVNLIRRIVDGSAQEFENLLGGLVAGQSEVGIDLAVIRSRGGVGFCRHSRFPKRSGKPLRLRGG